MPIDDRCHHVPTAPGQRMCTCLDLIMHLRLGIAVRDGTVHPHGPITYYDFTASGDAPAAGW